MNANLTHNFRVPPTERFPELLMSVLGNLSDGLLGQTARDAFKPCAHIAAWPEVNRLALKQLFWLRDVRRIDKTELEAVGWYDGVLEPSLDFWSRDSEKKEKCYRRTMSQWNLISRYMISWGVCRGWKLFGVHRRKLAFHSMLLSPTHTSGILNQLCVIQTWLLDKTVNI